MKFEVSAGLPGFGELRVPEFGMVHAKDAKARRRINKVDCGARLVIQVKGQREKEDLGSEAPSSILGTSVRPPDHSSS